MITFQEVVFPQAESERIQIQDRTAFIDTRNLKRSVANLKITHLLLLFESKFVNFSNNRSQGTKEYLNQELLTPRCEIILIELKGPWRPKIISINNY